MAWDITQNCCFNTNGMSGWYEHDEPDNHFMIVVGYANCNHPIDHDWPSMGPNNSWGPNGACGPLNNDEEGPDPRPDPNDSDSD